jgi:hypothetical protein
MAAAGRASLALPAVAKDVDRRQNNDDDALA